MDRVRGARDGSLAGDNALRADGRLLLVRNARSPAIAIAGRIVTAAGPGSASG